MNKLYNYQFADIFIFHKIATADFVMLCIFTTFIIIAVVYFGFRWSRLKKEGEKIRKQEIHTLVLGAFFYIVAIIFYLFFNKG